ncbi:hypothetical protein [Chroococcidiopsis sp.]|uniref:hypothetical protein n=1 Tax=Chroococcidiopsis sp. TaxID=3088168 RepID=UPI003F337565
MKVGNILLLLAISMTIAIAVQILHSLPDVLSTGMVVDTLPIMHVPLLQSAL